MASAAAFVDGEDALASTFADPGDIERYRAAKAQGLSDAEAFLVGDNGIGKWGDDTTSPDDPIVALPRDLPGVAHNRKVEVTGANGRAVVARVADVMPATADLKGKAAIDLNPAAAAAIGHPGGTMPVSWRFIDQPDAGSARSLISAADFLDAEEPNSTPPSDRDASGARIEPRPPISAADFLDAPASPIPQTEKAAAEVPTAGEAVIEKTRQSSTNNGAPEGMSAADEANAMNNAPQWMQNAASAAIETAKGLVPTTVQQVAGFVTPLAALPEETKKVYQSFKDIIHGKPIDEAIRQNYPESNVLTDAEKTAPFSEERFQAAFGMLAQMAMAAGGVRGLSAHGEPAEAKPAAATQPPPAAPEAPPAPEAPTGLAAVLERDEPTPNQADETTNAAATGTLGIQTANTPASGDNEPAAPAAEPGNEPRPADTTAAPREPISAAEFVDAPEPTAVAEPPPAASAETADTPATAAEPATPAPARPRQSPDAFGTELTPVASFLMDEVGGVKSKSAATKQGVFEGNEDEWNGSGGILSHPTHNKIYNPRGEMPNQAAQMLYDKGLIHEATPDAMWQAVKRESQNARTTIRDEQAQGKASEAAHADWQEQLQTGEPDPMVQLMTPDGTGAAVITASPTGAGVELTQLGEHGVTTKAETHPTLEAALQSAHKQGLLLDEGGEAGRPIYEDQNATTHPPGAESSPPAQEAKPAPATPADAGTSDSAGGKPGGGSERDTATGSGGSGSGPELGIADSTKTAAQLAAEKAAADADLLKKQQAQDVRVGASKPLRAGEDTRPERDMFGADKAEGTDLFDKRPSAEAELLSNLSGEDQPTRSVKEKAGDALSGISKAVRDAAEADQRQGLLPPGSGVVQEAIDGARGVVRQVYGVPKFGDFEKILNKFGARMQGSHLDSTALQRQIKKAVPNRLAREAVFTYMDAGGDQTKVADWASKADPKRFPEYKAALKLTPEQTKLADFLTKFFDRKGAEGNAAGVLGNLRGDYINRLVDRRATKKAGGMPEVKGIGLPGGRLTKSFKFGKQRMFDNAFDAEQKGVRYLTKDPAELVPIYTNEMNKTIGTKNLIADLTKGQASDSRALAYPQGVARRVTDANDVVQSRLIRPNFKQRVFDELTGEDVSSQDYVNAAHPALSKFKWLDSDEGGKPILMEGNLALHPEIARHVNNIFSQSAIRKWYSEQGSAIAALPKAVIRTLDRMNTGAKEFLFSGSGFHDVTIGVKGAMVGADPVRNFFKSLPTSAVLEARDPKMQFWAEHGSQLAPDYLSAGKFMEGFSGKHVERIPIYGPYVRAVASHLFERFIPAMKMTLNEKYFAKNQKIFAKELASADVSHDQLAYLSAKQANEALSHMNYVDLGRNPTLQHIFSMIELAPDFLESRSRFTVRAASGLVGAKSGRLAAKGFVYGLAGTWLAMRVLNKAIDDDYHFDEPFGVVHGDRVYSVRTVQGDMLQLMAGIYHFAKGDPSGISRFTQSRESALAKLAQMVFTGLNYRGEKTSTSEAMREFVGNYVPIWAKSLPGLRNLTESSRNNPVSPMEQFLGAWGFHDARYSPISKTYQLAAEYQKDKGIVKDTGTYPVSKYQQLRYALEDGDMDRARAEYQKLKETEKPGKISEGFRLSVLHSFTGSQANDAKFHQSLTGDDRATYEAAVRRRHEILRRFTAVRGGSF